MKNFARVLALMLVATMLCVLFVACGATPADDPKEAKAALEENGYGVLLNDSEIALAGSALIYGGKVEATLRATKGDDYIQIVWFEDEEDADKYYESLDESWSEMEDEIAELEGDKRETAEEYMDKLDYGKSGNMVWSGTTDAVKAAS